MKEKLIIAIFLIFLSHILAKDCIADSY